MDPTLKIPKQGSFTALYNSRQLKNATFCLSWSEVRLSASFGVSVENKEGKYRLTARLKEEQEREWCGGAQRGKAVRFQLDIACSPNRRTHAFSKCKQDSGSDVQPRTVQCLHMTLRWAPAKD